MKLRITSTLIVLGILLAACAPAGTPFPFNTATPAPSPTARPATATSAASATPAETVTLEPSATAEVISVPDGLGGTLTLAAPPRAIVSLAPSTAEILFAIGAGKQVAAREDFTNYPPEAASLPSVGGMSGPISVEQVVALKPDLVIAAPITPPELIKGIQDLKIPVLMLPNPLTLAELYAIIELAGQATGHADEAKALTEDLQAREVKVANALSKANTTPTVFYELDGTDPAKPWTTGPGTFIDLLITRAGGQNIGAKLQGEWAQLSQEDLLVENPDFIILGDSNFGMTAEQVAARPGWDALKAVKASQVLPINDDLISRPGPRMLDGLETLAKMLHPELAEALK
jgi:iron complex transport system substrate-binding protein